MRSARTDRGQWFALEDLKLRDVLAAFDLRHGFCLRYIRVIIECQDHGGHSGGAKELRYVTVKLLIYVIVPREEVLGKASHETDLAVAEHCLGLEWGLFCESLWCVLFKTEYPRRVNGH